MQENLSDAIAKILAPIKRRLNSMVNRAIIKAINDGGGIQLCQISLFKDEVRDGIERIQEYGFTSVPKPGAESVVAFVGGNRDHGIVIAVDDRRYRLKGLAAGEVAIYTDEGDKIHFKRGRKIEVSTLELTVNADTKVTVNTATATVNADTKAEITTETASVTATTKAEVTAPEVDLTATSRVNMDTPLLTVSGVVLCAGIGVGGSGGAPSPGFCQIEATVEVIGPLSATGEIHSDDKVTADGNMESGADIEDSTGTMQAMRSTYNSHVHKENNTVGNTDATTQTM